MSAELKRKTIIVDDVSWSRLKIIAKKYGLNHNSLIVAMFKAFCEVPPSSSVEAALVSQVKAIFRSLK